MNLTTVSDKQTDTEVLSRDEVYTSLMHGLMANLPTPRELTFVNGAVNIKVDTAAELLQWRDWFGMGNREVSGQPYPSLSDPTDMDRWLSRVWMMWRGWHLGIGSTDPITGEQRDGWVNSGQAATFAKIEAKEAAKASGLDYSRDPTPVSPARPPAHIGEAESHIARNGCREDDETPVPVVSRELAAETEDESAPISAAIRFSEARREALPALRAAGLPLARLGAATLDVLHGQALAEEVERARRADLREGEQGRILNPEMARFLAKKEEKRRVARHFLGLEESAKHYPPAEVLHMQIDEMPF